MKVLQQRLETFVMTGSCMDLNRIGTYGDQELSDCLQPKAVIPFLNQSIRTRRQAASTAVAKQRIHCSTITNGFSGTHSLARTFTLGRTDGRVEPSLAKVEVQSIAEAHHQPWAPTRSRFRPVQALSCRMDNGRVGSHVYTMNPGCGEHPTQICNRRKVLVAGTTN
jgi:hypothetical protein